jgi:hypothetical protein
MDQISVSRADSIDVILEADRSAREVAARFIAQLN